MLRPALLLASRSGGLRHLVESSRISRNVVARFVAGEDVAAAISAASSIHRQGMMTTLDVLGEDVTSILSARQIRDEYLKLLYTLHESGQAKPSEVSVKLSALGQGLPGAGHEVALKHAREICVAADAVECRVTLDMEDHTTIDSTLDIGQELRTEFPLTGNVLQANLLRTPSDIERLANTKARIRIVKGAYREPADVAFQRKSDVDRAYLKAIAMLMDSSCYPMVATHDPAMLTESGRLAERFERPAAGWEAQMLFGIGADLQRKLVKEGRQVRTYIPFGTDWYGYFMRRLAERPANVAFFLRALVNG